MWRFYDDENDYERERDRVLRRFRYVQDAIQLVSRLEWQDEEKRKKWTSDIYNVECMYNTCCCYVTNVCYKPPVNEADYNLVRQHKRFLPKVYLLPQDLFKSGLACLPLCNATLAQQGRWKLDLSPLSPAAVQYFGSRSTSAPLCLSVLR